MFTHKTSLFLVAVALFAPCSVPSTARAAGVGDYVDCLDQAVAAGQNLDLHTASLAIVAWACREETGTAGGVKFEACCASTATLVVSTEKNDFIDSSRVVRDMINANLAKDNAPLEAFWSEFGVNPHRAARCAEAMFSFRRTSGFWQTLTAEDELGQACPISHLAPEMMAECSRRAW